MPGTLKYLLLFITILLSINDYLFTPESHMTNTGMKKKSVFVETGGMSLSKMEMILQKDTSLFQAFRNLRFAQYQFSNELVFSKSKKEEPGVYHSINQQYYQDSCRYMQVENELMNRNFYTHRDKHRFWTARLYDSLFYTSTIICGEPRYLPMIVENNHKSRVDHYTDELKVLIFRPGMETDLPFIGNKTAIFTKEYRKYYDFEIRNSQYNGRPVYVFKAVPKAYLTQKQLDNLAIRHLETYLDQEHHQVLFRKYHVKMSNWLFDCDIHMQIDMHEHKGFYFPSKISYDGFWDIIGLEGERGRFNISFYNFK